MMLTAQKCVEVIDFTAPNEITPGTAFQTKTRLKSLHNDVQNFNVQVYLSYDRQYNTEDKLLGSLNLTGLEPYGSREIPMNVTVDNTWLAGRYYLITKANDGDMYKEVKVLGQPNAGADYVPTNLFTWGSTKLGEQFSYAFSLQNVGSQPAGICKVRAYLSTDLFVDGNDVLVKEHPVNSPLSGGGRLEFTGWFNIPANLAKGDYQLIFVADAANTVSETVEWNNRISTVISVTDQFMGEEPTEARDAHPNTSKEAAAEGFAPNLTISPNPVTGIVMLAFSMPGEARVGLKIFNMNGRMVEEMPERMVDAGEYSLPLDLNGLPNGVYVATIEVEGTPVISKKVVVQH